MSLQLLVVGLTLLLVHRGLSWGPWWQSCSDSPGPPGGKEGGREGGKDRMEEGERTAVRERRKEEVSGVNR